MRNPIRFYYDPAFIAECIDKLVKQPFWSEGQDGYIQKLEDDNRVIYLSHTLPAFGFYNFPVGNKLVPVQVRGNIAREANHKDLRDFVTYLLNRLPGGNKVLDRMTMQYNQFFDEKVLTSLRILDSSTLKDNRSTAYRYYRNGVVKVSSKSDSVSLIPYDKVEGLVWADQIIDREYKEVESLLFDEDSFLEDKTDTAGNHFHKWCQNLCKSQDHSGSWIYNKDRFKALSSGFGYLLHKFWSEYKCVIFIDEDMKEGRAEGRTGKSVVLHDALSHALNTEVIDAKSVTKKGYGNQFMFNFLTPSTQYVCFDDACEDFDFSSLFSVITGPLLVNRKYGSMFQFPKNEKPKMSISSNHPILGDGSSFEDRQHNVSIGGFYRFHKMELNKDPHKFHGGYLFDEDWGDENWYEFDAFCVSSLLYYLHNGLVNKGEGSNYRLKKLNASVGSSTLVNTIHRFLEDNTGMETYSHYVEEMGDESMKCRCLRDFVTENSGGETYTLPQLTTALHSVANHFDFKINVGLNDRPQKRFGPNRKGVNRYVITTSKNPFGSSVVSDEEPASTDPVPDNNSSTATLTAEEEHEETLKYFEQLNTEF